MRRGAEPRIGEVLPGEAQAVSEAHSATLRIAFTNVLSFTFLPRWLRTLGTRTTVGPVQLMPCVKIISVACSSKSFFTALKAHQSHA